MHSLEDRCSFECLGESDIEVAVMEANLSQLPYTALKTCCPGPESCISSMKRGDGANHRARLM
jgi:hypothetical protein